MKLADKQSGFTMIELLIAMAYFSFLLLFVTFGFIQINRSYTRGITVKTIQQSSRTLIEDISRSIRNSDDVRILTPGGSLQGYRLCFSGVRYAWNQHQEGQTEYSPSLETTTGSNSELIALVRVFDSADCDSPIPADSAEEVLNQRAAIQHLSVEPVASETYKIILVVASRNAVENGDIEAGNYGLNAICKVQVIDQFCDVARFETVVSARN